MKGTLVLALDRVGRLQTAFWSDSFDTVQPTPFSAVPSHKTDGERNGLALRQPNERQSYRRKLKATNHLLWREEEKTQR